MSEETRAARNKFTFEVTLDGWKLSRRSSKDVTPEDRKRLRERIARESHAQCGDPPVTEGDVGIHVHFYNVPDRWDPDDLAKPIMDCLRNLAYKDDSQVIELLVRQFKGSGMPRIEIEVLKGDELSGLIKDYLAHLSVNDLVQLVKGKRSASRWRLIGELSSNVYARRWGQCVAELLLVALSSLANGQ